MSDARNKFSGILGLISAALFTTNAVAALDFIEADTLSSNSLAVPPFQLLLG